jgi:hypothetical protein
VEWSAKSIPSFEIEAIKEIHAAVGLPLEVDEGEIEAAITSSPLLTLGAGPLYVVDETRLIVPEDQTVCSSRRLSGGCRNASHEIGPHALDLKMRELGRADVPARTAS